MALIFWVRFRPSKNRTKPHQFKNEGA